LTYFEKKAETFTKQVLTQGWAGQNVPSVSSLVVTKLGAKVCLAPDPLSFVMEFVLVFGFRVLVLKGSVCKKNL
jgi:hypothetical protein